MAIRFRHAKASELSRPLHRRPPRRAAYQHVLVALAPDESSGRAVRIACELAGDRAVSLAAAAVIEVPLDVPLETPERDAEIAAREAVREAQGLGSLYGISVEGIVLHARDAGEAIVAEAVARRAQVVVVAASWPRGRGRRRLDRATDHVLKHAPCRVLLIADAETTTAPVFRCGKPSDYWPSGEFVDAVGSTKR